MNTTKFVLYGVMIACLFIAGTLDAVGGNWKSAILACMYGAANAIIFFWRTGGEA